MHDTFFEHLRKQHHHIMLRHNVRRVVNMVRQGQPYPQPHQRFKVPVHMITQRYVPLTPDPLRFGARMTGCVVGGPWDRSVTDALTNRKAMACQAHFEHGLSWEDTGIYAYFARAQKAGRIVDNCYTHADVVTRYTQLDHLYAYAKANKRFPDAVEQLMGAGQGLRINLTRDGVPLFANQGYHRLAIAHLAGLETVTIVLGVTHAQAYRDGHYANFLQSYGVSHLNADSA